MTARLRSELTVALEETLRERPAAEWDELLRAAGVPAARVVSVPEALASPQVRHRGLVSSVPSAAGDLSLLGLPTHVDGAAVAPASPPPLLGEHTAEVLASLGFDEADVARLHAAGAV